MDKELVLATAGSGKTTEIINKLNKENKILLITYTDANYDILKNKVIEKFKEIPNNIKIYTYFSFLYSVCFAPLKRNWDIRGLDFRDINNKYLKKENIEYYLNKRNRKMYHRRLASFCNKQLIDEIKNRLEKYFDIIYVDEVQDFAGHDFNFLLNILEANVKFFMVGDYYQHSYDSSQDGNVNINLYKNYDKYINMFKQKNIAINIDLLKKSKRCSATVCKFIKNKIGINIESDKKNETIVKEIDTNEEILKIIENKKIVKLFYNNHIKYNIENTNNWGNSKGETYKDVSVILNDNTYKMYKKNMLNKLPQQTKNKLYVACSRTKNNLYFIEEKKITRYKK